MAAHLEVYDHSEHEDGGDEVQDVRQVLSVEGFSQGAHLVCARGQEMEESDDGSLKLRTWKTTAVTVLAIIIRINMHICYRH